MPIHIGTNWGMLYCAVDGGEPFELATHAVCNLEGDLEAPEEFISLGDLTKPMTFSIDIHPSSSGYKNIMRLIRRGNNWRRMHGLKPIRVPLKERRRNNAQASDRT